MHWAEQHVNPMLTIRNILCSDRWKEEWPKIEAGLRKQRANRRTQLRQAKILVAASSVSPLLPSLETNAENTSSVDQPLTPKKAKPNPWRNFKHGKALFQRSFLPKI